MLQKPTCDSSLSFSSYLSCMSQIFLVAKSQLSHELSVLKYTSCVITMVIACAGKGNGECYKHNLRERVKAICITFNAPVFRDLLECHYMSRPFCWYYIVFNHPSKGNWVFAWNRGLPQMWVMVIWNQPVCLKAFHFLDGLKSIKIL